LLRWLVDLVLLRHIIWCIIRRLRSKLVALGKVFLHRYLV
jgi:hypothetical protein